MKIITKISIPILLGLLIISATSQVSRAQGPGYTYPAALVEGATFEWEVKTLTTTGSVPTYFLDYGNETLKQGDKFSVNITANIENMTAGDPSQLLNLSNYWVDFYLNGVWKSNSTDDIGLIELDWIGWPGLGSSLIDYFFIQPPTYFNSTGTYNNFLIYHNNFDQGTAEFKTSTEAHAYSESYGMKGKTTSRLSKNTWTITYEMSSVYHEHDATDPDNWWIDDETIEVYYELRFNVETGILVFLQYDYSFHDVRETEGSTDIDDEVMNLLIESTNLTTNVPFNWVYSLLGIISLGMLVIIIKRKKRK